MSPARYFSSNSIAKALQRVLPSQTGKLDMTKYHLLIVMTRKLVSDEDFSFMLKRGHTLDESVSGFCKFYEESNSGPGAQVRIADLVPGHFAAVQVTREMVFGGAGLGLLLFYCAKDSVGGVSLYTFTQNPNSVFSDRPVNKIREQFREFFSGKCDDLITVNSDAGRGSRERGAGIEKTRTNEQPSQELLTPLSFCRKCGAAIAIDNSTYCWNCGANLPANATTSSLHYNKATRAESPQCDEIEYDRNCMICRLRLDDGQLLAWCPKCGAPAHRVHMLEWLHVKATCPACGQRLDTPELEEQLSQAHLQRIPPPHAGIEPRKREERSARRKGKRTPSKRTLPATKKTRKR